VAESHAFFNFAGKNKKNEKPKKKTSIDERDYGGKEVNYRREKRNRVRTPVLCNGKVSMMSL